MGKLVPDRPEPCHHGIDIIVVHHVIKHLLLRPIVGIIEYGARFAYFQMPAIDLRLGTILSVAIVSYAVLRFFLCTGHQGREHRQEYQNLFHRLKSLIVIQNYCLPSGILVNGTLREC